MTAEAGLPVKVEPKPQPDAPSPYGRLRQILIAHRYFVLLMVLGIVLRIIVMLAFRPALPLRNGDAYQHLLRSITMSHGESFHPFLYSVLIKPMVALGNLTLVTLTQHLAALAMAVLLYLLLFRLGLRPVVAALSAAPVLLDGYQLDLEQHILSETFFQLFILAALVVLAWNARPTISAAAGAGVLIGLGSVVRFAGLSVIVGAVVYALLRSIGWIRILTMLSCFLVALMGYATWFQSQTGTFGITNRNGFFLYGRVASFADCQDVPVPQDLQVFCPTDREGAGLFRSGLPARILRDPGFNSEALDFSKRMIRAMPLSYAAAVLSDFTKYFTTTPLDSSFWRFPRKLIDNDQRRVPPGIEVTFRMNRPLAGFLRGYQSVIWLAGPLLALLLGTGLTGGVAGLIRARTTSLAPEAWLFTLAALGLLLFAPVFAVYQFRYVIPVVPLAGAAAVLGVAAATGRSRPEASVEPSATPPVWPGGPRED
jgi:hypothetical protein